MPAASKRTVAFAPWLLAILVLSGCGAANPLERQALTGAVTLGGEPLEQGAIQFVPQDSKTGIAGGAVIQSGAFRLPAEKGLPPGKYKVMVFSGAADSSAEQPAMPGESGPLAQERIPAEFNVESEVVIEIVKGKSNQLTLDIP